jgi:hypothetical protein
MKGKFNYAFAMTLMLALATFHTTVNSETVCKGSIQTDCTSNPSCIWVNAYVTKNGSEVDGYCRVKPGGKSSASKAGSKERLQQAMKNTEIE